jgi:hypothetical protein
LYDDSVQSNFNSAIIKSESSTSSLAENLIELAKKNFYSTNLIQIDYNNIQMYDNLNCVSFDKNRLKSKKGIKNGENKIKARKYTSKKNDSCLEIKQKIIEKIENGENLRQKQNFTLPSFHTRFIEKNTCNQDFSSYTTSEFKLNNAENIVYQENFISNQRHDILKSAFFSSSSDGACFLNKDDFHVDNYDQSISFYENFQNRMDDNAFRFDPFSFDEPCDGMKYEAHFQKYEENKERSFLNSNIALLYKNVNKKRRGRPPKNVNNKSSKTHEYLNESHIWQEQQLESLDSHTQNDHYSQANH